MKGTFAMIKPNAVRRGMHGNIIKLVVDSNFVIKKLVTRKLLLQEAQSIYREHREKDFYKDLCAYVSESPVVLMHIVHNDPDVITWKAWRELMGATDPKKANFGSIRNLYATSRRQNAVHGSDSKESAERELQVIFK